MNRFIRNIFLRNWGLKLFSFILATVLWFALVPEEKIFSEKMITVPLELHNIPTGLEVVEKPASTVDVTIRAPNRLINQFTAANVNVVLDLQQASADLTDYPLNIDMIRLPPGAEVKGINPSLVKLRMEPTKQVELSVEVHLVGKLAEGLKIVKIESVPAKVPVKGPASKVKENAVVKTSPIDRSQLTGSTEKEVDLILPNPDLKFASAQTRAKVKIVIEKTEGSVQDNPKKE